MKIPPVHIHAHAHAHASCIPYLVADFEITDHIYLCPALLYDTCTAGVSFLIIHAHSD